MILDVDPKVDYAFKHLFGRGANQEKLAAIKQYCEDPNPDAVLIFVADHISIPSDARRMEMTDKDRYQKIREDLGPFCGIVELSRVEEGEAVRWIGEHDDIVMGRDANPRILPAEHPCERIGKASEPVEGRTAGSVVQADRLVIARPLPNGNFDGKRDAGSPTITTARLYQ